MATDTVTTPAEMASGTTKVFKNFIDGEWVASSTGETFEDRNPADTREVVAIFQKSGKADVDAAVDAAKHGLPRSTGVEREAEAGREVVPVACVKRVQALPHLNQALGRNEIRNAVELFR